MRRLFGAALLVASGLASAATFTINASNPGPIIDAGRDLQFDISAISGEIRSAELRLSMNYSNARELSFSLEDSGGVLLSILPVSGVPSSGLSMIGNYRISDNAVSVWQQGEPIGGGNLAPNVAVRAWQFGPGGICLNLLGRFLEFDINKSQPITLHVGRLATPSPGSGTINQAQLVIETGPADALFATGVEEPATPFTRCQRAPLDLTLNGNTEGPRSPLVTVQSHGARDWNIRHLNAPFFEVSIPGFSSAGSSSYVGRFGGRSRMNLGFWDPSTGNLNFTTGAGARFLELPGDWVTTEHYPIPGDYDGDGVTDLAMAFFANNIWFARILYSSNQVLRDHVIDPRQFDPAVFSSNRIGFGSGQDADRNGVDEITVYAQVSAVNTAMRAIQFVVVDQAVIGGFSASWGVAGDQMVLGDWSVSTSGNQFGLMVVRETAGQLAWFRFPDTTPVFWGIAGDLPISIDADGDGQNDLAVWRPSDQRWYVVNSGNGVTAVYGPFGSGAPLAFLQGVIAPPLF